MKDFEVFSRNKGPQCMVGRILVERAFETSTEALVMQLLACGLNWYWRSQRDEPPLPGQEQLPAVRPLTRLLDRNSRDLVLDLEEMDENREYRWITLIGLKAELSLPYRESVEGALPHFLAEDDGLIEIIILREGDSATEYIFLPRQPSPAISCLLDAWQVDLAQASRTRPYKTLDWLLLHLDPPAFPVFLRSKGEKQLQKYDTIDDLRDGVGAARVQNGEYEGWDKFAFPIVLRLPKPSVKSLEVERYGENPQTGEALKMFIDFAAAQGAVFSPPQQFHDLRPVYDALRHCIQATPSRLSQ